MAAESALCSDFLYAKLNVSSVTNALGTASRIYRSDVPQYPPTGPAAFPCVVYHMQAGSDSFGVGAIRIMTRPLWTVKVGVDDQPYEDAEVIYSIVDATIQGTSGTVSGGSVYSCFREMELPGFSEKKSGGGHIRWVGGVYRMEVRATTTP